MVTLENVRTFALSLEAAEEEPHFDITSFRVKKKIFVTMNPGKQHITIRLSPADQSMFCEYNPEIIFPVSSAWGKYGWTHINLLLVEEELLQDLIIMSYCIAAPKKLAQPYLDALRAREESM